MKWNRTVFKTRKKIIQNRRRANTGSASNNHTYNKYEKRPLAFDHAENWICWLGRCIDHISYEIMTLIETFINLFVGSLPFFRNCSCILVTVSISNLISLTSHITTLWQVSESFKKNFVVKFATSYCSITNSFLSHYILLSSENDARAIKFDYFLAYWVQ